MATDSSARKSTKPDPYYGHRASAVMCASFITGLFACPELPPTSGSHQASHGQPAAHPPNLAIFVAYALHRTRLAPSVTFVALFLLQRLKDKFPAAKGSSGHRLFISAFMIASKIVCDDTYSNKSWAVVGQNMFQLKEINQMEREMCSYLNWQLTVEPAALEAFSEDVAQKHARGETVPGAVPPAIPPKSSRGCPMSNAASSAPTSADLNFDIETTTVAVPNKHFAKASAPARKSKQDAVMYTPKTLASSACGDDLELPDSDEMESPSHSSSSSPASSTVHTPPSHANEDTAGVRRSHSSGSGVSQNQIAAATLSESKHRSSSTAPPRAVYAGVSAW